MQIKTFNFKKNEGWSIKQLPVELDSDKTLILIFCAPDFLNDDAPIKELSEKFPKSTLSGCSSAGEIFGTEIHDQSISVAVIKFEFSTIKTSSVDVNTSENSFKAGKKIAEALLDPNLKSVFVLSDGLKVNGSELVKGLNSILPESVVVSGGLAGDGSNFKSTWIIKDRKPTPNHVSAIGFYGSKIKVGHGSKGGWDIFGPERRVTRSKANVLYELDNKPALALYKEYLGDRAKDLPASGLIFPLMIRKDQNDINQLVRTILAVNEADQSLTFAGDIPTGYLAKLMRANFDRLVTGANDAAIDAARIQFSKPPVLAIAVSCVGRRLLLGERTEEETEATLESLPKGTEQIGFYSYGEISPFATGKCDLHNQTMTLTTLAED